MENLTDISFASANNYYLIFNKIPNLQFYLTSMPIPTVSNDIAQIPNATKYPFIMMENKINYSKVTMNWIMDEYYETYTSMYDWFIDIPDCVGDLPRAKSDATIIVLNNMKTPILRFFLTGCILSSLGPISYDAHASESGLVTCTAEIAVEMFSYQRIKKSVDNLT